MSKRERASAASLAAPDVAPPAAVTASPSLPVARRRTVMGALDVGMGALLAIGIWTLLPIRWWPVDVGASLIGAAFVVSGGLLLVGHARAERVATIVAGATLAIGLGLVAALAFTVGSLFGLYGPVGQGGAVLLFVITLLVLPYLVLLPAAQVYVLLPRTPRPR